MWQYFILSLSLIILVIAEDPFCNNRCYDTGISISKNCYCDAICSTIFNDCCGDSEYLLTKYGRYQHRRNDMTCRSVGNKNLLVVDRCSSDWRGPDAIRNSCSIYSDTTVDPLNGIFVTNPGTGVTYANYYCAICNSDAEHLIFWNSNIVCPTMNPNLLLDKAEIMKYIIYNRPNKQWGFVLQDDVTKIESFHACDITPSLPSAISSQIRLCHPYEVKDCAPTWKEDTIKRMCNTYNDPVYFNGTRYKNFYCALCNRIDQSFMTCGDTVGARSDEIPDKDISGNFALLLDFDFSDGNQVGKKTSESESTTCRKGEVYDPFAKLCRNVVCGIPGYTMKNGRCSLDADYRAADL